MWANRGRGWNRRGWTALLLAGLALLGLSCNVPPSSGSCQKQTCANAAAGRYQTCEKVNGNIDYNFPGEQCTCLPGNVGQCLFCARILAGTCGSVPTIGPGGTKGTSNCVATFSGAVSGTSPSCAVTIMYAPVASATSVTTQGGSITGTPYIWGAELELDGMPAAGTLDHAHGVLDSHLFAGTGSAAPPTWAADFDSGSPTSNSALEITDLGPGVDVDGQIFYEFAHGTWTGRLVDQDPPPTQPDVTVTITF